MDLTLIVTSSDMSRSLFFEAENDDVTEPGYDESANINDPDVTATTSESSNSRVVILAINYKSSYLGWAYYDQAESKICVAEDMLTNAALVERYHANWWIIENLIYQIKPTIVLLSARIDESVEQVVESRNGGFRVDMRPTAEFSVRSAINRLTAINTARLSDQISVDFIIPDDDNDGMQDLNAGIGINYGSKSQVALLDLSCRINLDEEVSVGCAGAVVSYAQKIMVVQTGLYSNEQTLRVNSIERFGVNDVMFINSDTINALRIFDDESHPNFHTYGSDNIRKEGLSLFGIINSTVTPFGNHLLKSWFMRPSCSMQVISNRHDAISLFITQDNLHIAETLKYCLKPIKNIPHIVSHLGMGKATLAEWKSVLNFSFQCLKIRSTLADFTEIPDIELIHEIMQTFDSSLLREVCEMIGNTIDFDISQVENRIVVQTSVDPDLDNLKSKYDSIEDVLSKVATRMSVDLPDFLAEALNILYYPQLGYLVVISLDPESGEPKYVDDSWKYQFKSESRAYFKCDEVRQLDETFGDLYGMICDLEIELIHGLQVEILRFADVLLACCKWTAELDCILALADAARIYRYHRPIMTQSNVIEIKNGRHPLYELAVQSFVENDTYISSIINHYDTTKDDTKADRSSEEFQRPSVVLLTGANFSGKSVYLKQVALIVFMAHIGSFVPAEFARIGITDKILTRVVTRETVSKEQSTFMVDLQQVSAALQLCTNRSLCIIDEFGKGTESSDGAGLFGALVEYLMSPESGKPKVLASTHFHELFENDVLQIVPGLALMHMQVLVDEDKQVEDKITYLYHLMPGRSSSSYGIICAALNGVPADVVARAEVFAEMMAKGEDIAAICSKLSEKEVEDLEQAEHVARRFLQESFGNQLEQSKVPAQGKLKRILFD
ncbi:muts domain V-domain-containing protein [Lipomyces arxii]|uniref:muts domain V-domain-containing protein n=1 Tax=Lipomyces arxii TaxID=56418 RepID=UPI0034CD6C4A